MKIRKATIKDLGEISELAQDLFEYESSFDEKTLNMEWTYSKDGQDYIKKTLTSNRYRVIVAEDENKIAGFVIVEIKKPKSYLYRTNVKLAELDVVFVGKEYRRRGVGSKIFKEVVAWAKKNKVNRLRVEATHANNIGIGFYKKSGFKEYELILEKDI